MKNRLLGIVLAGTCAGVARADFNPVALTPSSYTVDIVVEASAPQALPYCINVTAGGGVAMGDYTYYEQGLYARKGQTGGNTGIPPHNTVFTSINNSTMKFLMPSDYTVNNTLMLDSSFTSGTLLFSNATTATNLAILCTAGGGSQTVSYTVNHADGVTTETGTLSLLDWYTGGSAVAWGANGRVNKDGGYGSYNSSSVNNNPPYLYALQITVSGASPVTSIALSGPTTGNHGNFYAVSGNATGTGWEPIPLDSTTYNVMAIAPATFPLTATMDQGTNTVNNGNLATWFETGFVRGIGTGLPASGSTFDSLSQPTHHYQLADYTTNNAILIDTNHLVANITPATPATYSSFALLTAGGNVGGTPMTNLCILQHANGVNETNIFLGYDWFYNNAPGAIAYKASGRVNMYSRTVNNVGNNYPYLFETYFLVNDTSSPVTNIQVRYKWAGSTSSTTYVMALSASSGGIAPVVDVGPEPSSQTVWPGATASFAASAVGTAPVTGYWQVQRDGSYYPLSDGLSAAGSYIFGSQTGTLTISNVQYADGTNYQYVAVNSYGTGASPDGLLTVRPQQVAITPASPVFYTSNDIPLSVVRSGGPAATLQWYFQDVDGNTNLIANATNDQYVIKTATLDMNGANYGVIAKNAYGTFSTNVILSISDSPAFLNTDLSPLYAEAYAGAPVTYKVDARGNSPMTYQWTVNGNVIVGANSNSYTFQAPCGTTTIQVSCSNDLSGATWVTSSQAVLTGTASPRLLTFNQNGTLWQTNTGGNGAVPKLTNNVLVLTDGGSDQRSSAFYTNALYVGGAWTASFTYNSHGGAADGAAFILQNTNITALGGTGGSLGYKGAMDYGSLAFELNLWGTAGTAFATNGNVGVYASNGPVYVNSTNPVSVRLEFTNGVMTATLKDTKTLASYVTNFTFGSVEGVLGGNLAYVGFAGATGGSSSTQTISDFQFQSYLPPVSLAVTPTTAGSFILSWPTNDSRYILQTTPSLSSPAWVTGPSPAVVGGVNKVTVSVNPATSQQYYRLGRVCQ
jgi:hypothetical protein